MELDIEQSEPRSYRPGYKIEEVRALFVNQVGEVVKAKPWNACDSLKKIFSQENGANVINQESEKLTVEVDGEFIDQIREIEEDSEDLKVMLIGVRAKAVLVRMGNRTIR
jgi:hypothetical protein